MVRPPFINNNFLIQPRPPSKWINSVMSIVLSNFYFSLMLDLYWHETWDLKVSPVEFHLVRPVNIIFLPSSINSYKFWSNQKICKLMQLNGVKSTSTPELYECISNIVNKNYSRRTELGGTQRERDHYFELRWENYNDTQKRKVVGLVQYPTSMSGSKEWAHFMGSKTLMVACPLLKEGRMSNSWNCQTDPWNPLWYKESPLS